MSLLLVSVIFFMTVHTYEASETCPARGFENDQLATCRRWPGESDALVLSSSLIRLNDSICPSISIYTFMCELYRDFSQLTWNFKPDNVTNANELILSQCRQHGWNINDLNYMYTFLANIDLRSKVRICDTVDYRLTVVVTQDKGHTSECCSEPYTSLLIIQPLTTAKVPFTVSCLVYNETSANATDDSNDGHLERYTMTTHHGFIEQHVDDPQLLNCTTTKVNGSGYVNVTVSWNSVSKAESAALAFYHVTFYTEKVIHSVANLTANNSWYSAVLPPSHETYSVSITAVNKCGQMSERITAACINSATSAGVYLNIIVIFVCMQICV